MSSQLVIRLLLLSLGPLTSVVRGANGALLLLSIISSLAATAFDVVRQRRKLLPFPMYLLMVYAAQLTLLLLMPLSAATNEVSHTGSLGVLELSQNENFKRLGLRGATGEKPLRTVSVVIAAHNEHQYLPRTLNSIIQETPPPILLEIIVVDDGSIPPLKPLIQDYSLVQVLRHDKRRGLIKSKTEGGNMAVGDMIMFLDAHVKPYPNWYKPLFKHMNINYKRVVVPLIPILDGNTWQPNNNAVGVKMMFDWTLFFQWFEDGNDLVPCMSGGLFGISKRWWHESGEYDYGMNMWGAENIEQSIRIWLCGGEIYVARDSRIAHVFRASFPYSINNTEIYINKVRTVETWFDDYKEEFYKADAAARSFRDNHAFGDISDRLALKQSLQCKPFEWYVEKFKDVFKEKHMLPEEIFSIQDSSTGLCLQVSEDGEHVVEAECQRQSHDQHWVLSNEGKSIENMGVRKCLDANAAEIHKDGTLAFIYSCYRGNELQTWQMSSGHISWTGEGGRVCLKSAAVGFLFLEKCSSKFLQATGPFKKIVEQSVS